MSVEDRYQSILKKSKGEYMSVEQIAEDFGYEIMYNTKHAAILN